MLLIFIYLQLREKIQVGPKEKESTKNFKTTPKFQAESDKKVNIT